MARKELFDKKFVTTAIILGIIYVLIVGLVGSMIGKDVAGVAGVALTALATALFGKFETLQFRRMSDEESVWVEVPPINFWRVAILIFGFIGAIHLSAIALAYFLPDSWATDWRLLFWIDGITLLVYFILSFVGARAFVRLRYSTVAFAVLLNQISAMLLGYVFYRSMVEEILQYGWGALLRREGAGCVIFEIVALLGVRLGLPNQRFAEKSSELPPA